MFVGKVCAFECEEHTIAKIEFLGDPRDCDVDRGHPNVVYELGKASRPLSGNISARRLEREMENIPR